MIATIMVIAVVVGRPVSTTEERMLVRGKGSYIYSLRVVELALSRRTCVFGLGPFLTIYGL